MPTEFVRKIGCYDYHGVALCDSVKLVMAYDGSGRRISKTVWRKDVDRGYWYTDNVTHYTGIGTEVREAMRRSASPETKVVVKSLQGESRKNKLACSYDRTAAADAKGVHMPEGLGRYQPEDAEKTALSAATRDENGRPTSWSVINPKFEWYLKNHQGESSENVLVHFHCRAAECCALRHNHLGSTMMVYGTGSDASANGMKAAYDYRAFGERVDYTVPTDKITETFTGKGVRGECCDSRDYSSWHCRAEEHCAQRNERNDETQLNYFGARYLYPMLGLWTSVDAKRQYQNPYLYAGNNPIMRIDPDGNQDEILGQYFHDLEYNTVEAVK